MRNIIPEINVKLLITFIITDRNILCKMQFSIGGNQLVGDNSFGDQSTMQWEDS
jgi:hypothetical protein